MSVFEDSQLTRVIRSFQGLPPLSAIHPAPATFISPPAHPLGRPPLMSVICPSARLKRQPRVLIPTDLPNSLRTNPLIPIPTGLTRMVPWSEFPKQYAKTSDFPLPGEGSCPKKLRRRRLVVRENIRGIKAAALCVSSPVHWDVTTQFIRSVETGDVGRAACPNSARGVREVEFEEMPRIMSCPASWDLRDENESCLSVSG